MKLLENTNSKITKQETGENVPHLKITQIVLVRCYIVSNNYQQKSRDLYTFSPNKLFGQLIDISPKSFIILKTFKLKFPCTEVWFTDQNSKRLEREHKANVNSSYYLKYNI